MSLLERALQLFAPTYSAQNPTEVILLPAQEAALKAATGPGVAAYTYATPLWSLRQTPQQMAYQAAALFATHDTIRKAEAAVSGRAGSVPWHLEVDEENVDDTAPPAVTAIRNLVEKPQAGLPMEQRQPGMGTRRGLWTTTIRHMGLTGTSFWFLDQTDALAGIPLGVLYIAPWRMFPVVNERSALLGWSLDKPVDEGGTPLRIEDVLPFYLQPPDMGYFASGLVQAASSKIPIGPIVDRHIASVIGNGGRLTGLISPKENTTVTDDQWRSFLNDYRNITSDPNAAQRLQIVKGPVDYVRTAATMAELGVIEVDKMTNEAILTLWGVPGTQVGHLQPAGLNSGGTKAFDEAVLWQGAIAARLESFYETVQYGLLDRFKGVGIDVELVLDPPSFDDDAPLYAKAEKAQVLPLTNDERRELVGKEPLDPAVYGPWGQVIVLPGTLTEAAGPGIAEKQAAQQALQEAAQQAQAQAALQPPVAPVTAEEPPVAKASVAPTKFAALRRNVDENTIPRTKRAVAKALQTQKADIIEYLKRVGLDHLRRKNDFRWNSRKADEQLKEALVPEAKTIVRKVTAKTHAILAAKATVDEILELVLEEVLAKGGDRITAINRTTRDAVAAAIAEALADAQTIGDIIDAVNGLSIFDEYRAEMIARTETMFAYNTAALGSYGQMGVDTVQAIDGEDFDAECKERDGQVYSVEEAANVEDHPNGTLDWVPVVPDEEPVAKATHTQLQYDLTGPTPLLIGIIETAG